MIHNLEAKIRTEFTHGSLLPPARASRLNPSAKLAAPAASMTMPVKHSASKLKPRRIRLPKDTLRTPPYKRPLWFACVP